MHFQNSDEVLHARHLYLSLFAENKEIPLIRDLSFSLTAGQTIALVGASGAGKSALIKCILRFNTARFPFKIKGNLLFGPHSTNLDLVTASIEEFNDARSKHIAWIAQDSFFALNPAYTCKQHLEEALIFPFSTSTLDSRSEALGILDAVGLPTNTGFYNSYPHQISGGQTQRLQIACALAKKPHLLFADEPVSSLDPISRNEILTLLKKLATQRGMGIFIVSHDLDSVRHYSDEIIVLEHGAVVEQGSAQSILDRPKSTYGKTLLRTKQNSLNQNHHKKHNNPHPVLSVKNLSFTYRRNESNIKHKTQKIAALNALSFDVYEGEILGIVGASGSGKSTLARCLAGLATPSSGKVIHAFNDLIEQGIKKQHPIQLIFQDAAAALNPFQNIEKCLQEALYHTTTGLTSKQLEPLISELLFRVGLSNDLKKRMPHQISGGQKQRFCIARSLCFSPKLMLFDEALSALDILSQLDLLKLIRSLNEEKNLPIIFISHDIQAVRNISDRIAVLSEGKIIETNTPEELIHNPQQEYTRKLIDASFLS